MSFEVLQPPPAVGHVSVLFKNYVLVWGGYTIEVSAGNTLNGFAR